MNTVDKQTKAKRKRLSLLLIALLLVSVTSAYAWWTAHTQIEQNVSMGNLKIEAKYNGKELTNYEPGTSAEVDGTIKNTGSIPALIKIENNSEIVFSYNDDLTPIDENNRVPEPINPDAIEINYEPKSGLYEDNDKVFWFEDNEGTKFLLLEKNAAVKTTIKANFSGENMGNKYMDSKINLLADIKATQVLEGAILSEFGLNTEDLTLIMDEKIASRSIPRGQLRLQELLNRGK
ncbi:hypothetical protein [Enterococcus sp. RIT-PI-f]|uniref:hypothetical protein n=1 Tax=Enterococcus sp. RIT-PI-f TaxID=1690244 RepID=UPI0035641951